MARPKKSANPEQLHKTKLIMKAPHPAAYYKTETTIDFLVGKKNTQYKKHIGQCLLPTYNKDQKSHTPGFIIPMIDCAKDEEYEALHKKKYNKVQKKYQNRKLFNKMIPKPRSKNKYCGICRDFYQEYIEHLQEEKHLTSLSKSNFQRWIIMLCQEFRKKFGSSENELLSKTTSISTAASSAKLINEDENSTECLIDHQERKISPTKQINQQSEIFSLNLSD